MATIKKRLGVGGSADAYSRLLEVHYPSMAIPCRKLVALHSRLPMACQSFYTLQIMKTACFVTALSAALAWETQGQSDAFTPYSATSRSAHETV